MGTGTETELELNRAKTQTAIALSPDGTQLALKHADGRDGVVEITPARGGPTREVYRYSGLVGHDRMAITWGHDGRYLIFSTYDLQGNATGYMRVSADGRRPELIGIGTSWDWQIQSVRSFGPLVVHPSGRQIVYTMRDGVSGVWALETFLPAAAAKK